MKTFILILLISTSAFSDSLKEDPRCNKDFVDNFVAKHQCAVNGNLGACQYLAIVGVGALGGAGLGGALGGILKKFNPDKTFLNKYKTSYEAIRANEGQFRRFQAAYGAAEVAAQEKLYEAATGEKPKRDSSFADDDHGYSMKLEEDRMRYLKNGGVPKNTSALSGQQINVSHNAVKKELLQRLQGPENVIARQWVEENYRIGFNNELDFKRTLEVKNDKILRENFGSEKINGLNTDISADITDVREGFKTKKPTDVEEKAEKRAKARSVRNGAIGATGGALAGGALAVGGYALHTALEEVGKRQVDLCADYLKLTKEEVAIITTHVTQPKINICETVRLDDPAKTLLAVQDKLGFIPKGTCELALRENQVINSTLGTQSSIEATCVSAQGPGWNSKKTGDQWELTCQTEAGITYRGRMSRDGLYIPETVTASATESGKPAEAYADKFKDGLKKKKTREQRWAMKTGKAYEKSTSQTAITEESAFDYDNCFSKAVISQAVTAVASFSGKCSGAPEAPPQEGSRAYQAH